MAVFTLINYIMTRKEYKRHIDSLQKTLKVLGDKKCYVSFNMTLHKNKRTVNKGYREHSWKKYLFTFENTLYGKYENGKYIKPKRKLYPAYTLIEVYNYTTFEDINFKDIALLQAVIQYE